MIEFDGFLVENVCPICLQNIDVEDPDFFYPQFRPCCGDHKQTYRMGCIECHGGCGVEVIDLSKEECIDSWNYLVQNIRTVLERRGLK